MRVLGISSSPRRSGNSEILLDRALAGAASAGADAGKIVLNELDIKACQECGGCDSTGVCVIRDDMGLVYREIEKADAVIVASPVFFESVSAQAKLMTDRFQCAWIAKYVLKRTSLKRVRKGIFISVAGSARKKHFKNSVSVIRALFATLDIEYSGELFCGKLERSEDVLKKESILNKAYSLGAGLVN